MRYTRPLRSRLSSGYLRWPILLLVAVALTAAPLLAPDAHASADSAGPSVGETEVHAQQTDADRRDPESNLPYLFAVFIVTWGVLFGFVFFMSRRQQGLQREVEALKAMLAEREAQSATADQA